MQFWVWPVLGFFSSRRSVYTFGIRILTADNRETTWVLAVLIKSQVYISALNLATYYSLKNVSVSIVAVADTPHNLRLIINRLKSLTCRKLSVRGCLFMEGGKEQKTRGFLANYYEHHERGGKKRLVTEFIFIVLWMFPQL